MRILWLPGVVIVVLAASSLAHGQQPRGKPRSTGGLWAVSHTEVQPLAQPVSATNALPPTTNAVQVAAPVALAVDAGCQQDCGQCGQGFWRLKKLCNWICYRRVKTCDKGCEYFYTPPLYVFLLGQCHEGACYATQCQGPTCEKAGLLGKGCPTGHGMFAMPTGHGVPGVR